MSIAIEFWKSVYTSMISFLFSHNIVSGVSLGMFAITSLVFAFLINNFIARPGGFKSVRIARRNITNNTLNYTDEVNVYKKS